MKKIKSILEENEVNVDLEIRSLDDMFTLVEIGEIAVKANKLCALLSGSKLEGLKTTEDYYDFLISLKIKTFSNIVQSLKEELKSDFINFLKEVSAYISKIKRKDVTQYVEDNILEILNDDSNELIYATISHYVNNQIELSDNTIIELSKSKYNYMIIDNYGSFEKCVEKHDDIFKNLFNQVNFDVIKKYRLRNVFMVWTHICKNINNILKPMVFEKVDSLYPEFVELVSSADLDNVIQIKIDVDLFEKLLIDIEHPRAQEFAVLNRRTEELFEEFLEKNGQHINAEVPIGKIVEELMKIDDIFTRTLVITHKIIDGEDNHESFLDGINKDMKLVDMVSANVTTAGRYTYSYQNTLDFVLSARGAVISELLKDEKMFDDYFNSLASFLDYMQKIMSNTGEDLQSDINIIANMIKTVIMIPKDDDGMVASVCYGASAFICSLIEKLIRTLFIHLNYGLRFINTRYVSIGSLLNSKEIKEIFDYEHAENILYFLGRVSIKIKENGLDIKVDVGKNIRNDLDHWSNLTAKDVNPNMVYELLVIYTDAINTITNYLIKENDSSK